MNNRNENLDTVGLNTQFFWPTFFSLMRSWSTHFFVYRQLDFQSEPGSCLAIFENGLNTELTLPAKTCLNDFS